MARLYRLTLLYMDLDLELVIIFILAASSCMSNWLYIIISFQLNEKPVGFKTDHLDLTYLIKDKYDKDMDKLLNQDTPVVNLSDVKQGECNRFYERRMFQSQWGPKPGWFCRESLIADLFAVI